VTLRVEVEQDGAEVLLDDERVGRTADGGLDLEAVPHGDHTIRIVLPEPDKPIAPPTAALRVESDPPGAWVFLDDEDRPLGRTPLYRTDLAEGRHRLLIRLEGYRTDTTDAIRLTAGAIQEKSVNLEPLPALIHIATDPPRATVKIDGTAEEKVTPATYRVPAGDHEFVAEKRGYESKKWELELERGSQTTMTVRLPPLAAESWAGLRVETDPPGALVIFEDDQTVGGRTPFDRKNLQPGRYDITLEMEGYHPSSHPGIVLKAEKTREVKVALEPLPATIRIVTWPQGARVTIDDRYAEGSTPTEYTVDAGRHTFKASLRGHEERTWEKDLQPGSETEMNVTLTPVPPPPPEPPSFRATLGALAMTLRTDLRVHPWNRMGTTLRLERDLGLPGTNVIPAFQVTIGSKLRAEIETLLSDRSGEGQVDRTVDYNGHVIASPGERLEASSRLLTADLRVMGPIYSRDRGRIDLVLGGKLVHTENSLENPATNVKTTDNMHIPVIYYGLGGEMNLHEDVDAYARLLLTYYTRSLFDQSRATYVDCGVGARYRLSDAASLGLEYRFLRLDVAEDNGGMLTEYDLLAGGVGVTASVEF
jgi:hypothetical protein